MNPAEQQIARMKEGPALIKSYKKWRDMLKASQVSHWVFFVGWIVGLISGWKSLMYAGSSLMWVNIFFQLGTILKVSNIQGRIDKITQDL